MKLILLNPLEVEKYKMSNQILELLNDCSDEFVPSLSSRI